MRRRECGVFAAVFAVTLIFVGCGNSKGDAAKEAPPPAQVIETGNAALVTVDKPEQFKLVSADRVEAHAQLNVTGAVNPDISREVPVISLASGRVVDIRARLDDNVKKGDLLLSVAEPGHYQRVRYLSEGHQ